MPSTPRKRSTSATTRTARTSSAAEPEPAKATTEAVTKAETVEAAREPAAHRGHPLVAVATFPITAARAVAEDVVSAARRPDALAYWGGLAGLAALGILDWPVAAAVGVGVAITNGVRRSRA